MAKNYPPPETQENFTREPEAQGHFHLDYENDPQAAHAHDDIPPDPSLRDLPVTIWNIPRFLLLLPIRAYQATLSKTLPPNTCRFYPTCSHYGYQAIYKHGAIKGGLLAAWRVLHCNPFNPGGIDPVP